MQCKKQVSVATVAMVMTMAGPGAAQGVSCGGVGDGASWLGGTRAASDIAVAGNPLMRSGVSVATGMRGVGLFTLSQPLEIRVETQPATEFGDTVLELFDARGQLIITDDDSGGGLASRAEIALEPGDYCLAVSGFGGNAVEADLQVSRLDMPALTAGLFGGFAGTEGLPPFVGIQPCLADTPATQLGLGAMDATLPQGVSATNTIMGTPYYRFTLDSPQSLSIRAENPDADPYIYLFDGQGNLLAENDDYDSLNSRIDMTTPLAPGSYCIAMRALSDPSLPVTLSVLGYDAQQVAVEAYDMGEAAPPLDGSYPVTSLGVLPARFSHDVTVGGGVAQWFVVEVPSYGVLVVNADEVTDSDPVLSLFDEFGRNLAFNDDANDTLNSEVMVMTPPGRYLIAVRQYATDYSGIIRIGFQRFVPAQ